jgi:hypothetical protein
MGPNPVCYNYRATLISLSSCLKPIDTFRTGRIAQFSETAVDVGWVERSEPHTHEVKEIDLSIKRGSP